MDDDNPAGELIELSGRSRYRPDLVAIARHQVRQAREAKGATEEEFAHLLTPLLGWEVAPDLVRSWETTATPPGEVLVAASMIAQAAGRPTHVHPDTDIFGSVIADRFADLVEVYPTRAEFSAGLPARDLFGSAQDIKACGLSLNLICQQFGDTAVREMIERGTRIRCLFLDPAGPAIRAREAEEGFPPGYLSALTELNIQGLIHRVRDRLDSHTRNRLEIATYNETLRFNIAVVDEACCVVQPYLPESRGVDSPTFVISRRPSGTGLFSTFDRIFESLWERRKAL
jgi:hypothetical protein